jgi:hypothetical protein
MRKNGCTMRQNRWGGAELLMIAMSSLQWRKAQQTDAFVP